MDRRVKENTIFVLYNIDQLITLSNRIKLLFLKSIIDCSNSSSIILELYQPPPFLNFANNPSNFPRLWRRVGRRVEWYRNGQTDRCSAISLRTVTPRISFTIRHEFVCSKHIAWRNGPVIQKRVDERGVNRNFHSHNLNLPVWRSTWPWKWAAQGTTPRVYKQSINHGGCGHLL